MLPETWPLWAQLAVGVGLVCGGLLSAVTFLVRTGRGVKAVSGWLQRVVVDAITGVVREHSLSAEQVTQIVEAKVGPIHAEIRPNGGASLKDQVTRIDQRLGRHIDASVADRQRLRLRLDEHLSHHSRDV